MNSKPKGFPPFFLFQVMCSTSLLPINSPLRRLKKSVKTRMPGWRRWGNSRRLGGTALTSVIMGGCWMPACATLWLWPGPSVEVVYLGWEPCTVLRTRQASLPLIADLMPTALNVSVWYLFKNYRLKIHCKGMQRCSTSHWNGFHVLQYVHRMEMVQWLSEASTLNSSNMAKTRGSLTNGFVEGMSKCLVKVLSSCIVPRITEHISE